MSFLIVGGCQSEWMTVPLCRARSRDERSVRDVDVAEPALALVNVTHHERGKHAAVQDGENDVAAACELACRIAADETQLLILTSREAGEYILRRRRERQTAACRGVNDGGTAAVCAIHGYECENIRRCGKFLHEQVSLRPVHIGTPFCGRFSAPPTCRRRSAQARDFLKQSPVPF